MVVEHRVFDIARVMMTRAAADGGPGTFIGHAAVFNQRTAIGDPRTFGFWEEIDPAAFDGALGRPDDVRFLRDHNPSDLLARTAAGTLRLSADKRGLVAEADLPDTPLGNTVRVHLDRGDLNQMSFAFVPTKVEWSELDDGTELARVLDVEPLVDVSVVTFPAYPETDASARAAITAMRASNPLRMQRRAAALERLRRLSPPPGVTRKAVS